MPVFQLSDRLGKKNREPVEVTGELIKDAIPLWVEPEIPKQIPVRPASPPGPNYDLLAMKLTASLCGNVERPGPWVNVGRLVRDLVRHFLKEGKLQKEEAEKLVEFLKGQLAVLARDLGIRDATDAAAAKVERDLGMNGGPDDLIMMVGMDAYYYNVFICRFAKDELCPGLTEEEYKNSKLWQTYTRVLVAVYQGIVQQVFDKYDHCELRVR